MKIAVTGGAGFIGSHLVERLLANGHHVRVIDNLSTGCIENLDGLHGRYTLVQQDVATRAGADRACAGVDIVIHLAAIPSVARSVAESGGLRRDNLLSTLRVLDSADRFGVKRVVYASTCAVYAENMEGLFCIGGALSEESKIAPMSPYAEAKFSGELAVREFGERRNRDSVALRLFNVVGPRQRSSGGYAAVVPAFVDALLDGKMPTTFGDGEQTRDFTDVKQVSDVFVAAAVRKKAFGGMVINVGSGTARTINEVFSAAWDAVGGCGENVRKREPTRPGEMLHVYANAVRLWDELDMRCTDILEESVGDYADWRRGEVVK